MDVRIVTSGVDSEYVLSDLTQYLRQRGYDVLELDFGSIKSCVRASLSEMAKVKTVYITSAHTALSARSARMAAPQFTKLYPNYLAPVEILPLLKPISSIFVPHDLLTPFGDTNLNELYYIDLYDHVLAPYLSDELLHAAGSSCQIHDSGWIKYRENPTELEAIPVVEPKPHVSFLPTSIQYMQLKYGTAGFVEYLRPILGPNINIKFPAWKGIEELEKRIHAETGANIIPANVSSIELIKVSDVIICNTVSSILAEAMLLGKPCICLLDDEGEEPAVKQKKMSNFPELNWHPYRERTPIAPELIASIAKKPSPSRIKPFDFKLVESLIENASNKHV